MSSKIRELVLMFIGNDYRISIQEDTEGEAALDAKIKEVVVRSVENRQNLLTKIGQLNVIIGPTLIGWYFQDKKNNQEENKDYKEYLRLAKDYMKTATQELKQDDQWKDPDSWAKD